METLKGLPVANAINEKIIEEMKDWKGATPHLAIVRVGERPDDMSYERGATKKMELQKRIRTKIHSQAVICLHSVIRGCIIAYIDN